MKINRNKFIYLISPLKIKKSFYSNLIKIFSTNKVGFFQLRLKKESFKKKLIIGKKIIGVTCNNSVKLDKVAIRNKADYLAFGAFNLSKTKKVKYKASVKTLKEVKKITNKPIVAIGGISPKNYQKLLLNKANFLAISGYIWKNKKIKPIEAINKFK